MSKSSLPSEFKISETWDKCIEGALIKTSLGLLVGGTAAVVLFRGPYARGLFSGLAAGFGSGLAWNDCGAAFKSAGLTKLPSLPTIQAPPAEHKDEQKKH